MSQPYRIPEILPPLPKVTPEKKNTQPIIDFSLLYKMFNHIRNFTMSKRTKTTICVLLAALLAASGIGVHGLGIGAAFAAAGSVFAAIMFIYCLAVVVQINAIN